MRRSNHLNRHSRRFAIVSAAFAASSALAQTTYIGPTNGNWQDPANWSAGLPTSGVNAQINNAGSAVNVNLPASTTGNVSSLVIDAGDSLTLNNNASLNVSGNLTANGTLLFNTNPSEAFLSFFSSTATLSGLIDFNYQTGSPTAGVIQTAGAGVVSSTATIRGVGTLRNIRFTNAVGGLIDANDNRGQLYIDSYNGSANAFVNLGTMRATAGGLLTFAGDAGGNVDSTGGLIQANGAGSVARMVNGVSVTGGVYSTTGGGEIVVEAGHTAFLSPQSLTGTLRVRNNATLNINGNMVNNGTIRLTTGGSAAVLATNAPLNLSGTGSLVGEWSGTGAGPRIDAPSHNMTIGANQTHSGVIYYNNSRVVNDGLIDANDAAAAALNAGIYLDPNNQAADLFVNNGTMRSSNGGFLQLAGDNGGNFDNRNGTISSTGTGSLTEFVNGIAVRGGTYTTSSGGRIRVRPGHTAHWSDTVTIPAGSTVAVESEDNLSATLNANGTLNVAGKLDLLANADVNGPFPLLNLNGPLTLTGGGSIDGNWDGSNNGPSIQAFSHTLTINAGSRIEGVVYFNNSRVVNNGTIDANDAAAGALNAGIYLDPNNQAADLFVNNGFIRARSGGFLQIAGDNGGNLLNNGTITSINANSRIELLNNVSITGGTYTTNTGGWMGVRVGHSANLINPTISTGSTFVVEADASSNTFINLSGTATINGTLELAANADANGVSPRLDTLAPTTIAGTGRILGSYDGTNDGPIIFAQSNALTVGASAKIEGVINFVNTRLTNNGLMDANNPAGGMRVDPNNAAANLWVNNGTMRASNGGNITIVGDNGGNILNTGTIQATGAGSNVLFFNFGHVTGGTLSSDNGGRFWIFPTAGASALLTNVTLTAGTQYDVISESNGNPRLYTEGTIANSGTIRLGAVDGSNGNGSLQTNSPTTLAGTGTIRAEKPANNSRSLIESQSHLLTVNAGAKMEGHLHFNNVRLLNNGTIESNGAGSLYMDPNNAGPELVVNNGTFRATGNSEFVLSGDNGGSFGGTGPLVVDAGSRFLSFNSPQGRLGPVDGAGAYDAFAGGGGDPLSHTHFRVDSMNITSGGFAKITAGGGNAGTSRTNSLTIDTGSNGRFDITDHGLIIDYTGASPLATIRGYLATGRNNGFWNGAGINSSLANSSRAVGYAEQFETGIANFLGLAVDNTSVLVRYTFIGDTNLNGSVDFTDLLNVARAFDSVSGSEWIDGDFDYNGAVNFTDLLGLARNFGLSLLADGSTAINAPINADFDAQWTLARSVVPEPATLGLIAAGTLLALRRRH